MILHQYFRMTSVCCVGDPLRTSWVICDIRFFGWGEEPLIYSGAQKQFVYTPPFLRSFRNNVVRFPFLRDQVTGRRISLHEFGRGRMKTNFSFLLFYSSHEKLIFPLRQTFKVQVCSCSWLLYLQIMTQWHIVAAHAILIHALCPSPFNINSKSTLHSD